MKIGAPKKDNKKLNISIRLSPDILGKLNLCENRSQLIETLLVKYFGKGKK
jgi:hypothetical protein